MFRAWLRLRICCGPLCTCQNSPTWQLTPTPQIIYLILLVWFVTLLISLLHKQNSLYYPTAVIIISLHDSWNELLLLFLLLRHDTAFPLISAPDNLFEELFEWNCRTLSLFLPKQQYITTITIYSRTYFRTTCYFHFLYSYLYSCSIYILM